MNDITERLFRHAPSLDERLEAIAEIERLRARVAELEAEREAKDARPHL